MEEKEDVEPLLASTRPEKTPISRSVSPARALVLLAGLLACFGLWPLSRLFRVRNYRGEAVIPAWPANDRPRGLSVVALVLYNRAEAFSILQCYLKKNLVSHGGWLDEVVFLPSRNVEYLDWLDEAISYEPLFRRVDQNGSRTIWDLAEKDKTIYVKIDHDLVWLADDAVRSLVETVQREKDAYIVLGNIFNKLPPIESLSLVQFLPEMGHPPQRNFFTWRPSTLPQWQETPLITEELPLEGLLLNTRLRWLPAKPDLDVNAAMDVIRNTSWEREARQLSVMEAVLRHYNFLHHVETKQLALYVEGYSEDGSVRQQSGLGEIGLVAFRGSQMKKRRPTRDDAAQELTVDFPQGAQKAVLVQPRALAAQYSYDDVANEIRKTDLADRYRTLANEFACPKNELSIPEWNWDVQFDRIL